MSQTRTYKDLLEQLVVTFSDYGFVIDKGSKSWALRFNRGGTDKVQKGSYDYFDRHIRDQINVFVPRNEYLHIITTTTSYAPPSEDYWT